MPNRDQTGPKGEGSMTGRGMGLCNSDEYPYSSRRRHNGCRNNGHNRRRRRRFQG